MCVATFFLGCAAAAMGQSVSGEVSAQVNAAQLDQTQSGAVDAQVRAEYSGAVVESASGRAAGAARTSSGAVPVVVARPRARGDAHAFAVRASEAEMSAMGQNAMRLRSRAVSYLARENASGHDLRSAATGASCSGMAALAGACQPRVIKISGKASYSEGFADSTRGTALISPPDTGTSSPLVWSPSEVGGGGLEFMPKSFLNPRLHVGAGPTSGGRGSRNKRKTKMQGQPGASPLQNPFLRGQGLQEPSLEPSQEPGSTTPDILNPSALSSPLDTGENPDGDQQ